MKIKPIEEGNYSLGMDTTGRITKVVRYKPMKKKDPIRSFEENRMKYYEELKNKPSSFTGYGVDPSADSIMIQRENYLKNAKNYHDNVYNETLKYKIPYIKDKEIMLSKGRYNTGKISTNVLDSIYDSAKRTNTPLSSALGLAGRESTLGIGRGYKENNPISATDLYTNWQQIRTIARSNKDVNKHSKLINKYMRKEKLSPKELKDLARYTNAQELEINSFKPMTEHPIDNALKYYKAGHYNPGDKRHTSMVEEDGRVILSDPAVQRWLKTRQ